MKTLNLPTVAVAAALLGGCGFGVTDDEPLTAAPVPATTTAPTPVSAPATAEANTTPAAATAFAAPAKVQDEVRSYGAHIDASAFLNALVESGCQIDKAEYKEVKRGGAIKVVCSKSIDALNVELEDL